MRQYDKTLNSQRRRFLKQAANAGLIAGVSPWLASCGIVGSGSSAGASSTELRTYYFDLSNAIPNADHYLVAGSTRYPLSPVTQAQLDAVRAVEPQLQQVADSRITHGVQNIPLPANAIQLLYIKSVPRSASTGPASWAMHTIFYHIPAGISADVGQALSVSCDGAGSSVKGTFSICTGPNAATQPQALAASTGGYCTGGLYEQYKSFFDHAVSLVCAHPEICSLDPATLSYVEQKIVCADANILPLAQSLYRQGPATETGGWATQVPCVDPDTGQPKLASNGDKLYFTQHSDETLKLTGAAIDSVMPKIKNDPVLGANIAGLQPNTDDNTVLNKKLWVVNSAAPVQSASPAALSASSLAALPVIDSFASDVSYAFRDYSLGNGCNCFDLKTQGRTITFTVSNWYLRYLGIYVRFLDASEQPIKLADMSDYNSQFPNQALNGTYDHFLGVMNQEMAILGVPMPVIPPVTSIQQTYTVTLPEEASSLQILAGGLGTGPNTYPDSTPVGAALTIVLDLALPGMFLLLSAASAYIKLQGQLSTEKNLLFTVAPIFIQAFADVGLTGAYQDPSIFKNLGAPVFFTLLKAVPALWAQITADVAESEATDALAPGIGWALQAIAAAGAAASIVETSAEVARAPHTYSYIVNVTHDLTVTINHDPKDPAGFPATATQYSLIATCDKSSVQRSGMIQMPGTTQTAPLSYTFKGLPYGGKVNVDVHFYSSDLWLAGAGSTGSIDNTLSAASITITESLVPLTSTTSYGHKQKIVLDGSGNHVWQATTTAPLVQPPDCSNASGNLCDLVGITLSEPFGAIGYAWEASSAGVTDFASGASGQLYQFANLSFTGTPQSGYQFSDGTKHGFRTPARLAYNRASPTSSNYYLDTTSGKPIVRRITLTALDKPPTVDSPTSNQAVGKFNFASDAFQIHPTGKLISINTAQSKLEVLEPEETPVADAVAPLAQSYSGPGTREGLLKGPACMAITPLGDILVVEQANNRIQAFDTGANPTRIFPVTTSAGSALPPAAMRVSSLMPLRQASAGATFLDVEMEAAGYIYVLWTSASNVYTLDIYDPQGNFLSSTVGVNAGKLTVDLFRNIYTLNYETLTPIGDVTEPSISEWIPSTP